MINYNIIVKGKVQGVWFRKYTQDIAYNLNLNGFVRNCHDGSVFIEIEGKDDKIKVNVFLFFLKNKMNEPIPLYQLHKNCLHMFL